jgi:hypothetical protein
VIHRCRACEVAQLSVHPGFARALAERAGAPEVVYLWEDRTVTELPLPQSTAMFASDDGAWRELCGRLLEPSG